MKISWLAALILTGAAPSPSVALAVRSAAIEAPDAREAIARVAFAEAGNQGDSGLAGVVYTILNRLGAGPWGDTVEAVVNARGQFEPVMRAGGDWRGLRPATVSQRARIDTILNLALDGRLPDVTGGALYFQNPRIVAARSAAGTVSPRMVGFGGAPPSAQIGDHTFYRQVVGVRAGGAAPSRPGPAAASRTLIVTAPAAIPAQGHVGARSGRGLFVLADGRVVEDPGALAEQPGRTQTSGVMISAPP